MIVLDGSTAPPISDGPDAFMVDANNVTIRGFEIRDWHDDGVELHGDNNRVVANRIYNNEKIVARRDEFKDIVNTWLKQQRDEAAERAAVDSLATISSTSCS